MTIPLLEKLFSVQGARNSLTLRFSDGTVEHVQGDSSAYLFAACDRIEELEALVIELAQLEIWEDGALQIVINKARKLLGRK